MRRMIMLVMALALALLPRLAMAQAVSDDGATTPVDAISDFTMWGILLGAASSVLAGVINRSVWPSTVKFAVFFVWCVIGAAGDAFFLRELDWHHWSRALLVVVSSGVATYVTQKRVIQEIETNTNVVPGPNPPPA
jgi:peptidoglycan/LPS O-acetylase OafA/YrhL